MLDGAGNTIVKQILPQFISKTQLSSGILTDEPPSNPAGLMVDARGHARFMIAHGQRFASRSDNWVEYALDLYAVAPDGSMQAIRLDSIPRRQLTVSSDYYLRTEALVPDGEGMLALYSKRDGSQGEQWHGKYLGASRSAFTLPEPWRPTVSTYDGFGVGRNPSLAGPLVARNLRTGALHWQRSIAGIAMLGITGGGAAVRDDLGGVRMVEATGPMEDVDDLAIGPGQYVGARFHVRDAYHTLRAVVWKPLNDATVYTAEEADGDAGRLRFASMRSP